MGSEFHKPFRLGITGGIGSGKTSVCRVFSILGIPVFSADTVARDIVDNDTEIRRLLNEVAGKDLYPGGVLNRQELAALIFNDSTMLSKVNSLIHPAVFSWFESWSENQHSPYIIMEAAILFESGGSKLVDKVATVAAPEAERLERVVKRSGLTREQVSERMKNQLTDAERSARADYIISNSENEMIIPAVLKIHEEILKLCQA